MWNVATQETKMSSLEMRFDAKTEYFCIPHACNNLMTHNFNEVGENGVYLYVTESTVLRHIRQILQYVQQYKKTF